MQKALREGLVQIIEKAGAIGCNTWLLCKDWSHLAMDSLDEGTISRSIMCALYGGRVG